MIPLPSALCNPVVTCDKDFCGVQESQLPHISADCWGREQAAGKFVDILRNVSKDW